MRRAGVAACVGEWQRGWPARLSVAYLGWLPLLETFMNKSIIALLLLASTCYAEIIETDFRQMTGTRRLLAIRVQFPDMPNTNSYSATVSAFAIAADRTAQKSYHKLALIPEVTSGLYTLPHNKAYYASLATANRLAALKTDAITLAQTNGYDVSPTDYRFYDRVSVMLPPHYGLNTLNYHTEYLSVLTPTTLLHEIGHGWGFAHAGLWVVNDGNPVSPSGHSAEYSDQFDIMAQSYSTLYDKLDYNMFFKYWAGWLDDAQIATSNQVGTYTYTINRFDNENAVGVVAVKVSAGSDFDYWVGYRRGFLNATDATKTSAHGAYIIRCPKAPRDINHSNTLFNRTELIDTQTPGTIPKDAALPIGKTLTINNITITPTAEGGTAPHEWLAIQVTRKRTNH